MPYAWLPPDGEARRLRLWPHRSMTAPGFAWFIGLTAAFLALPLVALLGSPVLWGLLPFALVALGLAWWALGRSRRDGALVEELRLARERVELVRREPEGRELTWSADPWHVRIDLHAEGGPVEDYLTLRGGGRTVELGRFLSPGERRLLHGELAAALARLR